jgi:signal transduction histidine kinase
MENNHTQFAWLDAIPTACLILQLSTGRLCYANPAAQKSLNLPTRDQWMDQQLTDLFTIERQTSSGIWRRNGHRFRIQEQRLDHDGQAYKQLLVFPMQAAVSNQQIEDARRMAEVLVHRIRSPLNGVIGFADMLRHQSPSEELDTEWASLTKGLHTIKSLLDELNRFTEPISAQSEPLNVATLVDQVLNELPGSTRRKIEISAMHPPADLEGDPIFFRFIVSELLANAQEACEDELDSISISVTPEQLVVENSGGVISQEQRKQLFQPFFTTRARHLGLGLTQSWRYAHALQWELFYADESKRDQHLFTLRW